MRYDITLLYFSLKQSEGSITAVLRIGCDKDRLYDLSLMAADHTSEKKPENRTVHIFPGTVSFLEVKNCTGPVVLYFHLYKGVMYYIGELKSGFSSRLPALKHKSI